MKKLIVFLILYLTSSGFSQTDTIDIKCNILNHSTSPILLYETEIKYSGNKLLIELTGKSKIKSIIKNINFALHFYENKISIIGIEKLIYYNPIYPEKDFKFKTILVPAISPEQIEEITIFPLLVNYSINLKWSLHEIIKEQARKFALMVRKDIKETGHSETNADTIFTIMEEQYSINAHQDKTKFKKVKESEPAIDTVKEEQVSFDTLKAKEITAVNIKEIKSDSTLVLTNIVTEVLDDEVMVSLGENYINKKKKYLIVREEDRIQKRIALAKPVNIEKSRSRLKLIYYYTKVEPEIGDLFYEYIELREKFNPFDFVIKHKIQGLLGLGCISAAMSYIYHQKANDSFDKYKNAVITEDAQKYRMETEDFEKTRNTYLYATAFLTGGAVISYIYDKFINRKNNREEEFSKIEMFFQSKNNILLGITLRY